MGLKQLLKKRLSRLRMVESQANLPRVSVVLSSVIDALPDGEEFTVITVTHRDIPKFRPRKR